MTSFSYNFDKFLNEELLLMECRYISLNSICILERVLPMASNCNTCADDCSLSSF